MIKLYSAEDHRSLWRLAGPIIISNITVALQGIVDTAVVGHLDKPQYLGGITLAMVIFNFLYWGLAFLRMGTTGLVAQSYGENSAEKLRAILGQAVALAMLLSLLVLLCRSFISDFGFWILEGSAEVSLYAREYYDWAIWAAPAVLINLVVTGWLLGTQRAIPTLILAVTINLVNIVLDLVFVLILNMDVRGVALATVIAQFTGLVPAMYFCRKVLNEHPGDWRLEKIMDAGSMRTMLSVNHNIFIRTVSLLFVFAYFTHQGAAQGDVILAANAVLMNFYFLMALGLDGFAMAAEAMVGKSVGARDRHAFWHSVQIATLWSLIFAIVFAFIYLICGKLLVNIMTDLDMVRTTAYEYIPWLIIAPLITTWCFMWDGVYTGATRAIEMRNTMLFSTFCIFLPAWYLLQGLGNTGLWLALTLFMLSRSVSMTYMAWRIEKRGGFVQAA
ncbi:MAG: MATE family efflux transporter [Thiotrichales bacterium]|nr:MATE family efflux transporter [Thiotrichales bacterium]